MAMCQYSALLSLLTLLVAIGTLLGSPPDVTSEKLRVDDQEEVPSTGDITSTDDSLRFRRGLSPRKVCVWVDSTLTTVCGSPVVQVESEYEQEDLKRSEAEREEIAHIHIRPSDPVPLPGPITATAGNHAPLPASLPYPVGVYQTTITWRDSEGPDHTEEGTPRKIQRSEKQRLQEERKDSNVAVQAPIDQGRALSTDPLTIAKQLLSQVATLRRPASTPMRVDCDLATLTPLPGVSLPELLASNPHALANLSTALNVPLPPVAQQSLINPPDLSIQPQKPAAVHPIPPTFAPITLKSSADNDEPQYPQELTKILINLQKTARQNVMTRANLRTWVSSQNEDEETKNKLRTLEQKLAQLQKEEHDRLVRLQEEYDREQERVQAQIEGIQHSQRYMGPDSEEGRPIFSPGTGEIIPSRNLGTASLRNSPSNPNEDYRYASPYDNYGSYGSRYGGYGRPGYAYPGYMNRPHMGTGMGSMGPPYGMGVFRDSDNMPESA